MQYFLRISRYANEIERAIAGELMGLHIQCLTQTCDPGLFQLYNHTETQIRKENLRPSIIMLFKYPLVNDGRAANGHYELLEPVGGLASSPPSTPAQGKNTSKILNC